MPRVDRWVIAQACRSWPRCARGPLAAGVHDQSLRRLGQRSEPGGLHQRLPAAILALPGPQIGFELTETAAIGNLASASQLMTRLRSLGSPIALDDFGSGMSSFSYLKALPIDFLKIDGAFVRDVSTDPVDRAVVEAIQRIGRVMGIQTIAESVEDEAACGR